MTREIAVLVSTFQRPQHLLRCLASIEMQRGVEGRFEVVVTDDGSTDSTLDMVRAIARRVSFPLKYTTHEHDDFRLARCRNEGVAASTAPYLLFTDGDCVLPQDHLAVHLRARRQRCVVGSDCLRLGERESARVDVEVIRNGNVGALVSYRESMRIGGKALRAKFGEWFQVPMRPRLTGNNIAMWRSDFERINGFDERFVGWGLEDRDLQLRIEGAGIQIKSILWRSPTFHLWHPQEKSFARNNIGTRNWTLFHREDHPVICFDGLKKTAAVASMRSN